MRKNRLCATATDAEISAIAKDWFRFAADREGGRKKSEDRKREREAAINTQSDDWKFIRNTSLERTLWIIMLNIDKEI